MKLLIVAALMFPALVVCIATWLDEHVDTEPKSPKTSVRVAIGITLALYGILYLIFGE